MVYDAELGCWMASRSCTYSVRINVTGEQGGSGGQALDVILMRLRVVHMLLDKQAVRDRVLPTEPAEPPGGACAWSRTDRGSRGSSLHDVMVFTPPPAEIACTCSDRWRGTVRLVLSWTSIYSTLIHTDRGELQRNTQNTNIRPKARTWVRKTRVDLQPCSLRYNEPFIGLEN